MERERLLNQNNNIENENQLRRYKLNFNTSISLFTKIKSSIPTSKTPPRSPNTINSFKLPPLSHRKLKKRVRSEVSQRPIPVIETVFLSHPVQPTKKFNPIQLRTLDHQPPTTHQQFVSIVNSLKSSISNPSKPLLPKLNTSGSSGSYFCRDYLHHQGSTPSDRVEIVGIFKPKDEEPYGAMNPKWTKWAHRVLLAPLIGGFGRGCLIPNLSYLSEAAASLLDRRLQTFIVPRTEVISISSPTFFYSWLDLRKPELPPKPGSFQLFCQGFEDASIFLKKHPWPGFPVHQDQSQNIRKKPHRFSLFRLLCGHRRNRDTDSEDGESEFLEHPPEALPKLGHRAAASSKEHSKDWVWTLELMEDFRVEMEKLVILDYLMRNTDRGLDNFMIKVCNGTSCTNRRNMKTSNPSPSTSCMTQDGSPYYQDGDYRERPHCHVAAIDNSLAFPHHHPNGWREYAYGWLFLPASLIGQPFSRTTREYFLPNLTSQQWWAETVHELRKLFGMDPDFNVRMFERQLAVMKGQAWNIVESLKHEEEGPLELCRRQKALVWDEPVQVVWDEVDQAINFDSPDEIEEFDGSLQSTTTSHKVPPRPMGLASHHVALDGARGLDVMKQMDALEAWHTGSDSEVQSFRSHQRSQYWPPRKSPSPLHQNHQPMRLPAPLRSDLAAEPEEEDDHHASEAPRPRFQDRRSKLQSRIEREKLGLISIRSRPPCASKHKTSKAGTPEAAMLSFDDQALDDGKLITIGVVEKLEFVTAQPIFKNC
ncbi:hypothetical protein VP01_253g6 [Puccinia sorghi]|uniref:Phosphatidylinositol 4-kinase n=1 Tax=Puccinia sorghi TaxID=27349 RepID=A0A0L6V573_9BASI|nr:hypothetical protein VP01_253g6 [Puccinia sorghi]